MLAYNLSPSFNWDTTGMSDDQMRVFPLELGKLGYVFNFITYGGHQVDGMAAEEFATALNQDGMLSLARLQRKLRLVESPYKTPQTLVGGPRLDGALMACSGRTATTAAMGKGSTQVQHLVQTEVPVRLLGRVARTLERPARRCRCTARRAAAACRRLGVVGAERPRLVCRQESGDHLRADPGSEWQPHPLDALPGNVRQLIPPQAADDTDASVFDPSLQGRFGTLRQPQ